MCSGERGRIYLIGDESNGEFEMVLWRGTCRGMG